MASSSVKRVPLPQTSMLLDVGSGSEDSLVVVRWKQKRFDLASDVGNL